MCGIFGISSHDSINFENALKSLNILTHRGPDSFGEYKDDKIYLGHRRLSIIDLSVKGNQPLISNCGNIILTANGEIYNYKLLRQKLEKKYEFKSNSDSEVIIYGYLEWGIDKLLDLIDGMYAFSLYDKKSSFLFLVRDRVGIKPLYYFKNENEIIWASELKAIKSYRNDLQTDLTSLYDYLTYKYIPSPKTLYKSVYKLEPGHYLQINLKTLKLTKSKFWDVKHNYFNFNNINEIIEEVDYSLRESVESQMVGDVNVGAFLSSGVDSSLISNYASKFNSNLTTFTIGFNGLNHELNGARYFSNKINSSHKEIKINENDLKNLLEEKNIFFDEPFGDISPQSFLINKYASKDFKVMLTGDGGDELFFGYNEYRRFFQIKNLKRFFPYYFFKNINSKKINKLTSDDIDQFILQKGGLNKFEKKELRDTLSIDNDYDEKWFFKTHYKSELDPYRRLEYLDFKTFLPEHGLTRVDRNSMLFGLECRVPFLSNKMIDLSFSIRPEFKFHNNELKFITKEILKKYSSEAYAYSNKKGFSSHTNIRKEFYEKWNKNENISMIEKYIP